MVIDGGVDRRKDSVGPEAFDDSRFAKQVEHRLVGAGQADGDVVAVEFFDEVGQMIDGGGVDRSNAFHVEHDARLLSRARFQSGPHPLEVVLAVGKEQRSVEPVDE